MLFLKSYIKTTSGRIMKSNSFLFLFFLLSLNLAAQTINFPSEDGLTITADLYLTEEAEAPFIVLFHQAEWSRGEYIEIAPKLNKLGFNCMAVDLRSGGAVNEVENQTAKKAKAMGYSTTYADAVPDMLAAVKYVKDNYEPSKLIGWGSSYSSALILKLAGEDKELLDALLSFAPGEYFTGLGKPEDWITRSAKNIECPVFITSARYEKPNWIKIYEAIKSEKKSMFLPETEGNHGSRALWEIFEDSNEYWKGVKTFLSTVK